MMMMMPNARVPSMEMSTIRKAAVAVGKWAAAVPVVVILMGPVARATVTEANYA